MMLPYPIFIRQGHFSGLVLLICLFSALWFWRSNPARILRIKMVWYLFFSFSVDGLQPITSSHHHIQAQHNLSKKVQIRIQSPVPPLTFFQHSFCTPKMVSVWGWQRSWVLQWSASAMACSAERSKGSGRTSAVGAGPSQPAWLQKKLHLRTRHRGEENICQFTVQVINQCWITESKHFKTLGRGAEHFVDSWKFAAMACSANHSKGSSGTSGMGGGIIIGQPAWLQRKINLRPQHRGVHVVTEEILRQVFRDNLQMMSCKYWQPPPPVKVFFLGFKKRTY